MPRTLFALCREDGGSVVRRVPLEAGVQGDVEEIFDAQEQRFFADKDEPIEFNGDWKPDGNELLCITDADLLAQINETLVNGAGAYDHLDITDYEAAGVKALDLLPIESAFFSSLCSGFGPLLTVGDTPTV
ncbi:hypothetical protein [Salipiger abyssi]|uniref:hypothetical protein n=2 Tax=Salipiger abyssi TaxID=1250539 RepID=UPI000977AF2C|nr:hypothetical protein [Salipiger abyssi]